MVGKYFTRPQARVFGVLVEGASVRCSARQRLFDPRCRTGLISRPSPRQSDQVNQSSRSFVSTRSNRQLTQSQTAFSRAADRVLAEELGKVASVVKTNMIPEEEAVQDVLEICENLARNLMSPLELSTQTSRRERGPTSNLLSLEQESEGSSKPAPRLAPLAPSTKSDMAEKVATTAYEVMVSPKVFITPKLLATYITTLTILGRPQSFPKIFDLYASKAAPQPGTTPSAYNKPNLNRASSAVPVALAHSALNAAIKTKDLPLCLSIIDTTVCTTAYQRNKLLRKALLPATGLALAPAAAYVLASQLAQLQHSMDNQTATQMFFIGMVAYVGFTATIGVVAITTSNDQMDRITWAKGTPLRDRWLREDERALVDRVAGAWGFQDVTMRGEEEGVEWETLREWAGRRGMVLDSPELMEGME